MSIHLYEESVASFNALNAMLKASQDAEYSRAPRFDLPAAIDVLTTGTYQRMSDRIIVRSTFSPFFTFWFTS